MTSEHTTKSGSDEVVQGVDAPTAAQMAAEEQALRRIGPAAPLPRKQVQVMVGRALAAATSAASAAQSWRKPALLVAMLAVSLASLGWIGTKIIWPERRLAPFTLDYASAVLVATDPGYTEDNHVTAIARLDEGCAYIAHTLRTLASEQAEPTLAEAAREMLADLTKLLGAGASTPPSPVEWDVVDCAATANDAATPLAERHLALARLGELMRSGLTAILAAELRLDKSQEQRDFVLGRLAHDLRP